MKRFGFGFCLLIVLLLGCLGVWWGMEKVHQPVTEELVQAAALSQAGDGVSAAETAFRARETWEKHWHFAAAFADHTPMGEIDDLFRSLDAYAPVSADFAACCLQLAQRTQAMADVHAFNWWNLL